MFTFQVKSVYSRLVCSEQQCFANDQNVTCATFASSFPLLQIQISTNLFSLPPSAYCSDYALGGTFVLGVGSSRSSYVLGTTFIRNFYTQLNLDDSSISFGVSPYAPSGVVIGDAPAPTESAPINWNPLGIPWYFWLEIAIAIIMVIILVVIACLRCRHQRSSIVQLDTDGDEIEIEVTDLDKTPTFSQGLVLPPVQKDKPLIPKDTPVSSKQKKYKELESKMLKAVYSSGSEKSNNSGMSFGSQTHESPP
jgi:hypothetical protein